jgi:hypothetical protein
MMPCVQNRLGVLYDIAPPLSSPTTIWYEAGGCATAKKKIFKFELPTKNLSDLFCCRDIQHYHVQFHTIYLSVPAFCVIDDE